MSQLLKQTLENQNKIIAYQSQTIDRLKEYLELLEQENLLLRMKKEDTVPPTIITYNHY